MVVSKITVKNPTKLTATLTAGITALTNEIIKETRVDMKRIAFDGINRFIEANSKYRFLFTPEGRGIFGFAAGRFKFSSDTGPEDLIPFIKKRVKVVTGKRRGNTRSVRVEFPGISFIAQNMKHNLGAVNKTAFNQKRSTNPGAAAQGFRPRRPGARVSWFSWWESGDKGFIKNRTVLKNQLAGIVEDLDVEQINTLEGQVGRARTQTRQRFQSRAEKIKKLERIINLATRSREGIQLSGTPSPIKGEGVIVSAYAKIGRSLARSADRILARAIRRANRGGNLSAAFRRSVGFGGGF